jgi:hypothetical protein
MGYGGWGLGGQVAVVGSGLGRGRERERERERESDAYATHKEAGDEKVGARNRRKADSGAARGRGSSKGK